MKKSIFCSLACIALFAATSASAEFGIYYGNSQKDAQKLFGLPVVILQDYNFDLFSGYTGKKVCYLTVGEFDGSRKEAEKLGLTSAITGENSEWNSLTMNMGSAEWQKYLLSKEKTLIDKGCSGLFLDTIWQDGYEKEGVDIVKKIRENGKNMFLVVNNAHNIKNEIKDWIDAYMFENFWDKIVSLKSQDGQWYVEQMEQYAQLQKEGKYIYALSYGNPLRKRAWARAVLRYAKKYNFDLAFANADISEFYFYLNKATGFLAR